jgi:serine/threonine protein kinase, bacterial
MVTDDLPAGQEFGGYVIVGMAGSGGMGVVYRAEQRDLGRTVALKVIRPEIAESREYRLRFLREAKLASAVDHPHIVSVFEVGEQVGRLYIAMQWVDGLDLRTLLDREPRLDPGRAVRIGVQLAGALDALGSAGLVHRDVKPSNVLVRNIDGQDHAYLTDFGVAKLPGADDNLTRTGLQVGTSGYMAPELVRGEQPNSRSDLYALGCIMFEALTGQRPFAGDNDSAVRWAHANSPRPVASSVCPALGPRYDAFFAQALALEPGDRFASGRAFAAAVQSAHAALPGDLTRIRLAEDTPTQLRPSSAASVTTSAPPYAGSPRGNYPGPAMRDGRPAEAGQVASTPWWTRRKAALVAIAAVVTLACVATVTVLVLHSRTPARAGTPSAGTPIMVGSESDAIAISSDGRTAYVTAGGGSTVTPISLATGTPGTPIAVGAGPFAIAITPDHRTAYVTSFNDNSVTPINLATGTPGTPITVGAGPFAIAITPDGRTAYVANSDAATVTPISLATGTPGPAISVGGSPQAIAITPDGKTVYVANYNDGTITPINVATDAPGTPISVGHGPAAIAITPDGRTAYVANYLDSTVTPISLATGTPGPPIAVGAGPFAIAITPDGQTAYVADVKANTVTPVNLASASAGPPIAVGREPHAIAITPDGRTAYVANSGDDTVTPIVDASG